MVRAEDDNYYVIKVQNNPQGLRILANEMLGASIAAMLSLPVAPTAVISLPKAMVDLTPDLTIQLGRGRKQCKAGLCFGSLIRLDGRFWTGHMVTPESVENPRDFLGMLVFDKWLANTDQRQVALTPNRENSALRAVMIDQGFCFAAEDWTFRDGALQGVSHFPRIYHQVRGLEDFEPWLGRLEREIDVEMLRAAAREIPPEWYSCESAALDKLIWQLDQRRPLVRELLGTAILRLPTFFPEASPDRELARGRNPLGATPVPSNHTITSRAI